MVSSGLGWFQRAQAGLEWGFIGACGVNPDPFVAARHDSAGGHIVALEEVPDLAFLGVDDESQVLRAAVAHEKEAALTRSRAAAVAAMGGKAEQLAVAVFPEVPEGDAQLLQEDGFGEVLVREVFVQEQVDHQQVEVPEGMQELVHLCLDGRVLCWHSTMSLGWTVNLGRMCAVYLQGGET